MQMRGILREGWSPRLMSALVTAAIIDLYLIENKGADWKLSLDPKVQSQNGTGSTA
jgi:hypothetical protein